MKISRLQYITQDVDKFSHAELVVRACKAGAEWIQLRIKNKSENEIEKVALIVKEVCSDYNATFILNDYVNIAKEIKADGVHLGKHDISVKQARKTLGKNFIIGGTANTFEDIKNLSMMGVDYIGLGPFRFTSTKKNLSPILGLTGYEKIIKLCTQNEIKTPIVAIGGIKISDVNELLQAGVYGIAVSSAITNAEAPYELIDKMNGVLKTKLDPERVNE